MKKFLSLSMVGALTFASIAPNVAEAASANESSEVTNTEIITLQSNYEKGVITLEDGSKLELELDYRDDSNTLIVAEYDGVTSELKINEFDGTWSITETHSDGTVKYYDNEDIAEFVKIREPAQSQLNNIPEIMPLDATTNLINLGVSPEKASGIWTIEANFDAEITGIGSMSFSIFTTVLAGLAVNKLTKEMKLNNAVSSVLVLSAMINAMFNSIRITSGNTYIAFYHFSDVAPIDYDGFYRTQMLFFSDSNYKNRLYTVNYHWGYRSY